MNMKKHSACVVLVTMCMLLITACGNYNQNTHTAGLKESLNSIDSSETKGANEYELMIKDTPLLSTDPYVSYTSDSTIVQLTGMSNLEAQATINTTLQAKADEQYASLLSYVKETLPEILESKDTWEENYGTSEESFFYGHILNQYKVTYQNEHMISVVSEGYSSIMPQAHPAKNREAFVFDLETGNPLSLKDAIIEQSDSQVLFRAVIDDLVKNEKVRPEGVGQFIGGAEEYLADLNTQAFFIKEVNGERVITLYSEAGHAIGYYEVDLSRDSLGSLAKPASPIWR